MQISLAKKLFAVGSASAMVAALLPSMVSAAVHSAGTNCVSNNTVYFINAAGQRQGYTSAGAFLSYGTNSWSNVVACSAEDMALPNGSFVPPADGSVINDKGTIYLITGGQRAGVASPSAFLGLGYSWSLTVPGDTSFMTTLAPINSSAMAHPAGTLVNQDGTVYLISSTGAKLGIPTPAVFNSWGYAWSKVVLANSYDRALGTSTSVVMPAMMPGYLNPLAQIAGGPGPSPSPAPGPTPLPVSGGLSVSLAPTTPASSYVAAGAAFNTFTNLNFTAGSSPVIVTSVTVTRTGLGSDSDVNNVYLFNGTQRLALSTTLGSGHATFTNAAGLFTVPANGTTTITIKADLISGLTVGKTYAFGINSVSDVVTSGNGSVVGSFPLMGNLMSSTTLSNPSLATLGIQAITVGTTVNAGTNGVLIGQFQFQATNSNVQVKQIILTEVGSINSANDLANVKLMVGATQVGSTLPHPNSDGTSVFDLSANPYTITSGQNVTVNVYGDVLGTPNRSFTMTVQRNYDVQAFDTTYGAGILSTAIGSCTSFPVQQNNPCGTANAINVQAGNLVTTTDPNSPTGNVATSINNVVLSQFDVLASGEPVKLFSVPAQITYTDTGVCSNGSASLTACDNLNFANLRLVDDQGVQLGSTFSTPSAAINATHNTSSNLFTFSFGSTASPLNYVIAANTKRVLSIKADILSTFISTTTAFHADITAGSANAQGTISLSNAATTANLGRTLTVVTSPFTQSLSGALGTQTFVKGATGVRTGSFLLLAGAGEGIALSSVGITVNSTASTTFQNLHINVNGTPFGITQGSLINSQTYTFSGNPVTIPVGGTAVVDIYEDIQTNATAGTVVPVTLTNNATIGSGVTSGTSRTASGGAIGGQSVVIAGAGTLAVSSDSGTVAASNIAMGSTGLTMSTFKLTTGTNEGVNITTIKVTDTQAGTNPSAAISNIKLFDGQTQIGSTISALTGSAPGTATFQLSPAYHVNANTVKTLTVVADVNAYNSTASFSGSTHTFIVNAASTDVISTGDGSGTTIVATGSSTANAQSVFRTNLTVTLDPAAPNNQVRGINSTDQFVLYDFKASSNFDALVQQFSVTVTNSGVASITNAFKIRDVNGYITNAVVGSNATSRSGLQGAAITAFTAVTDNITAGDLTINGTSVGAITAGGSANASVAAYITAINAQTGTTGVTAAANGTFAAATSLALYRATSAGDITISCTGTCTLVRSGLTSGTTRVVVPTIGAAITGAAISSPDLTINGTTAGAVTTVTGQSAALVTAINAITGTTGVAAVTVAGVTAVLIRVTPGNVTIHCATSCTLADTGLTANDAAPSNNVVNLVVALPDGYTVSAGTTRVLTLEVDSTTTSWAHTGSTYFFVQPKITAVTWNDQGGSSANLPSLILPVVGGTNSY